MIRRPVKRRVLPPLEISSNLHPVLARAYAARGIRAVADLELSLDRLIPIGSLDSVDEAASLLLAHQLGRVLIIGDFDADGATASALMIRALRRFGFSHVDFLVPDRFTLGYGLSVGVVELAKERKPSLLVTVDNGVSSFEGVALARAYGMDVLITDHHLPGSELPDATVHVNPNLPGSRFLSKSLAGVGVAFYVLAALCRRLGLPLARLTDFLDLVALGTVADVVPLDHNNRILVHQGLRRVRAGRAVPGIRALCALAERALIDLRAGDFGFAIAPRINAAGRMSDMSIGIECLVTDDEGRALELAERLDLLNKQRRVTEAKMQEEALAIVSRLNFHEPGAQLPYALCLFDPDWHAGVVGLVAGRVKEQIHRPVVAFAPAEEGIVRGSARSVPGLHVKDILEAVVVRAPGLLHKFGGHAMAAGLTLSVERVSEFAALFASEVARVADPEMISGALLTDGSLTAAELSLETAAALREGGPWGSAFPEPCFDGQFTVLECRVLKEKHLKLTVRPSKEAKPIDAIAFNWLVGGQRQPPRISAAVDLVYRLDVNEYQGLRRPQLMIEDLELASP